MSFLVQERVTLGAVVWSPLELDCELAPAFAALAANYSNGATVQLNAHFSISASAFGISTNRQFYSTCYALCLCVLAFDAHAIIFRQLVGKIQYLQVIDRQE